MIKRHSAIASFTLVALGCAAETTSSPEGATNRDGETGTTREALPFCQQQDDTLGDTIPSSATMQARPAYCLDHRVHNTANKDISIEPYASWKSQFARTYEMWEISQLIDDMHRCENSFVKLSTFESDSGATWNPTAGWTWHAKAFVDFDSNSGKYVFSDCYAFFDPKPCGYHATGSAVRVLTSFGGTFDEPVLEDIVRYQRFDLNECSP